MGRLAEPIDALIANLPSPEFDVIVVGSGYGGSVAARRCADAGLAVAVLERGREYVPGDFPRDTAIAPRHFRIDSGGDTVSGYDDALFDIHVGDETVVLSGNGLGGGSLINAGVALTPDATVFAQEEWPSAIRSAPDKMVARCDAVAGNLHAMPYQTDPRTGAVPPKTVAFEAFAREATRDIVNARITVNTSPVPVDVPGGHLEPCVGCGDCVSGCNYGAKATLTETYLAAAYGKGAQLYVNASVVRVAAAADRWCVTYTRTTDQRAYQRAQARLAHDLEPGERDEVLKLIDRLEHRITAGVVVLAAGALGSTGILQRSASRRDGLATSWTLGSRFSGNGDYLSFGYWQRAKVDAVGWGSTGNGQPPPAAPAGPHPGTVGPTITRIARFTDRKRVAGSFIVEDAAVPGPLGDIFHELVTSAAVLHQLTRWSFKGEDPIARAAAGARHTQVFLTMGHDGSRGRVTLGKNQRVRVQWPSLDSDANFAAYDARMKVVERLGAVYLPNPVWTPIPPAMEKVLAGARFRGRNAIVHPLGGCPMADDGFRGTVNDVGAVFRTSSDASVHPGLFVLDGAIVPTSLGANPFVTITALAERAMPAVIQSAIARRTAASTSQVARQPRPAPALARPHLPRKPQLPVPVTLEEVLRGPLQGVAGAHAFPLAARLTVQLPSPDMRAFLDDPHHRLADARATLQLSPLGPSPSQLATWRYAEARGRVTILEPVRTGPARRLADCARVLATWLIERGADEIINGLRQSVAGFIRGVLCRWSGSSATPKHDRGSLMRLVVDTLRLAWHAADRRQMQYDFTFALAAQTCQTPSSVPPAPRSLVLSGRKDVQYAADWSAIVLYLLRRVAYLSLRALPLVLRMLGFARTGAPWTRRPRLERRNLWRSMTELDIRLHEPGARPAPFAQGRLAMAPVEMLDERPPQLRGEATSGLLGLGGYPLLFARYLLKCRLWDFRLPDYTPMPRFDYPRAPGVGAAARVHEDQRLPPLRDADGRWASMPESLALDVRLPAKGDAPPRVLPLVLWRYRNRIETAPTRDGALQCKSILLIHAFAQSAICFAEPTLRENLAEHLHRDGWDVWLLEHRISIGLPSALEQCSMDDIAQSDIPEAVRRCLATIRAECGLPATTALQMYALAQCVGSAALGMSILRGALANDDLPVQPPPAEVGHRDWVARQPSLLAGVVLSQFTPYVIGAAGSQFRSFLPTILRDVFGVRTVDFAAPAQSPPRDCADGAEPLTGQTETLIDRILATLGRDEAEHCWDEHQGGGATQVHASCRRMAGIEAPLFRHANLAPATHDRLPLLLGVSNIGVFAHARRCVEEERLVDADGLNVYVDTHNIQQHLHMPVAFLHGEHNALFSVGSSRLSHAMLRAIFPPHHAKARVHLVVFPDYGHVDWLLGKDAAVDCYPRVACFLRDAWRTNRTSSCNAAPEKSLTVPEAQLHIPAMGPLVGAVCAEDQTMKANVWMRPDDRGSTLPKYVVVEYGHAGTSHLSVYPITETVVPPRPIALAGAPGVYGDPVLRVRHAVATLRIPLADLPEDGRPLHLQMYSLHPMAGWRKQVSLRTQGPLEKFEPLDLGGATDGGGEETHADPVKMWLETLLTVGADGRRNFDRWRELNTTRSAKFRYLVDRTARTTLSRRLLKPLLPDDATFELRRPWVVPHVPGDATFLATNCRYPGFAFEQHRVDAAYRRLLERERVRNAGQAACALLLVGDQIYADATAGLFDLQTPIEKFEDRYRGLFTSPSVRNVVRRLPTYMVIDDHEIDDDWDRSDTVLDPALTRMALTTARIHQWSHSSAASLTPQAADDAVAKRGLAHEATLGGVIPTLFLDTRSLREGRRCPPHILAPDAWNLLQSWLQRVARMPGPKLIVTGSPIAPGFSEYLDKGNGTDPSAAVTADNWQRFDAERRRLFDLVCDLGVRELVLLSGDYHCSAIAQVWKGESLVATAVLAPPSYAPFDYANSRVSELAEVEGTGCYEIRILRDPAGVGMREDGSGYARFAYCAASHELTVEFDLCRVVDGKDPAQAATWTSRVATMSLLQGQGSVAAVAARSGGS